MPHNARAPVSAECLVSPANQSHSHTEGFEAISLNKSVVGLLYTSHTRR